MRVTLIALLFSVLIFALGIGLIVGLNDWWSVATW